ncbi:MAG: response regulator [Bacteroidia bacterium]|nr:response regulator [Bacteroidia bacterium]
MGSLNADNAKVSKVLMIDDNVIELNVCESILKSTFSCNVQAVKSVAGALDYLNKIKSVDEVPDIIICDLNLPYLDGYDFVKEYEKLPNLIQDNCKLFVLSGSYDDKDIAHFQKEKVVNRFLRKPLNTAELIA